MEPIPAVLIVKKTSTLAVAQIVNPQVLGTLAMVAVRRGVQGVGKVAEEAAGRLAGDAARRATGAIRDHLTDHGERLPNALATANERAWKTIEIALGGKGFWDRFASAEDRSLRSSMQSFLKLSVFDDDPGFLGCCLQELRQARAEGHLDGATRIEPSSLAEALGALARYDDPQGLMEVECRLVEEMAVEFQRLGYDHIGRLLKVTCGEVA